MQPFDNVTIEPVPKSDRQLSLDFIRGIAIFGILLMNIQSFGNIFASYMNPTVNDDFTGINVVTWLFTHIFFEQKFYTLFSMLFGAGIVLMAERAEQKGLSAAKFHYRRNIVLLFFGFVHGYFIWYGDILLTYAIFSLVVYLGWRSRPRNLIISGVLLTVLMSLLMLSGSFGDLPQDVLVEMQNDFNPNQTSIEKQVAAHLGTWSETHVERQKMMEMMLGFIFFYGIRIAGCMLIGMALYKLDILSGKRSTTFYKKLALFCLLPGFLAVISGAYLMMQEGFNSAVKIQMLYGQFNFIGSLLVAIGYVGLFHLIYRSERFELIKQKLIAVGQMAFSNYITQSLICTFIFYGFGLGLFGSLERFELALIALAIFALQLMWSRAWLSKFQYGPLEWLWRSITYWQAQPFIRRD